MSAEGLSMRDEDDPKLATLRGALRASTLTILVMFVGVGGWFHYARLDSAAVAGGVLENAASTKTVQHLEGGIVTEILVENGDVVAAGDLLLRLDPTRSAASADLYQTQLWSSRARQARLKTEVQLGEALEFPGALVAAATADPALAQVLRDEAQQFRISRETLSQSTALLRTQIRQTEVEIEGQELRRAISLEELDLVAQDLADLQSLRDRGLANQARVTELDRARLVLKEKIAQSEIDVARLRQQISAFELQIAQTREAYRERAAELLERVGTDIRSLERDSIVASDALNRIELRAPVAGTVQESILGTIGAVVGPGMTILKIVPASTSFVITAQISPNDIDSLVPGSRAYITFPAFGTIETKPAEGTLTVLSRDRIVDLQAQLEYYEAEITMDEDTLRPDLQARLVAGMAASVVLPTGERTALEYILSPLLDRLRAAMRED